MRAIILIASLSIAVLAGDFRIFSVTNDPGSDLPAAIEKRLEADGFTIAANSEMIKPFMIQFQHSDYDVFHLLTVYHTAMMETMIKKHPKAGIFLPTGVGIYQAKGDKRLHVSILTPEAQSKILGLETTDPLFVQMHAAMKAALEKAMPKADQTISTMQIREPEGPLVSLFSLETDDDGWEDTKEELEMMIEDGFKPYGFVMSNFTDYNYILTEAESIESPFDFYDTYSICKLKVIYNVAKTRPEAAAFAPCTLMVYKQKGVDEITIGFPGVYNWISSADVTDEKALAELMKAQTDFERILTEATE